MSRRYTHRDAEIWAGIFSPLGMCASINLLVRWARAEREIDILRMTGTEECMDQFAPLHEDMGELVDFLQEVMNLRLGRTSPGQLPRIDVGP